jgi:hypothetical protein
MGRGLRPGACVLTLAVTLIALLLAGCSTSGSATPSSASATPSSASPSSASPSSASASPGVSIPGTHKATAVYQISVPVSTVIVTSHAGSVAVTGGSGPGISVTEQVTYSRTRPVTSRAVSGQTLTVGYTCPTEIVCTVSYVLRVPRTVAVQATAAAGSIRLAGLAGSVTAKADVGLISATGLTGASVSLITSVGAINAAFAAAPTTVQATARVGAITLRVPGTASYQVSADAHIGKAAVSVPQSASSAHAITATTDVGAIVIAPSL